MFVRHPADKLLDQVFARLKQMVELNGILGHPFEAPLEFLPGYPGASACALPPSGGCS